MDIQYPVELETMQATVVVVCVLAALVAVEAGVVDLRRKRSPQQRYGSKYSDFNSNNGGCGSARLGSPQYAKMYKGPWDVSIRGENRIEEREMNFKINFALACPFPKGT